MLAERREGKKNGLRDNHGKGTNDATTLITLVFRA
jgi:hypothetical protein